MLKDIINTLKQSAIYGLSRISLKFVSFVLTPIITAYFSVAEYGVLDRFERFWQILFAISLFGLETALLRWYSLTENEDKRKSLIFTTTIFLVGLNIILLAIGTILSEYLSIAIFESPVYSHIVIYTFLIAGFEALMVIPLTLLRARNKPSVYLFVTLLTTCLSFGFQLYVLLTQEHKLNGIFISKFLAPGIVFIVLLPFLLRKINFHFDFFVIKEIIKFSFPLMLVGVVSTLLNSVNRFILGFISTSDDVGLFSMASNISGILTFILISPFQLAFNAIFWQKLKDENAARFYTKSMTYSVFLYIWGALALSLLIPYIIKIYIPTNATYWQAVNLVPILSLSLVFYGMLTIAYMSFHHAKKNDLIFYFQTGTLVLNIILNYILIPYWGMYGAAISTFISFFILIAVMYYYSKRYYFIKYETTKMVAMMLTASVIITAFFITSINIKWIDIILRILFVIGFPFILYIFKMYDEIEISTIKRAINKIIKK